MQAWRIYDSISLWYAEKQRERDLWSISWDLGTYLMVGSVALVWKIEKIEH